MGVRNLEKYLIVLILIFLTHAGFGQGSVPVGINYQAVALVPTVISHLPVTSINYIWM